MLKVTLEERLRKETEKLFSALGFDVFIRRRNKISERVLIDKNVLSHFLNNDDICKLYAEGIKKAGNEWSDEFFKVSRFFYLPQYVRYIMENNIEGDFVECGCWKGHSSYMIAQLLKQGQFKSMFHIFDSFEGLSDKVEKDANERKQLTEKDIQSEKLMFAASREDLERVLADFKFTDIHKGWIPDVFKDFRGDKVAFVHIDVDLYEPTLHSLEFFYPKMSRGGCIAVDDYGYAQFPGAKKAVDAFLLKNAHTLFIKHPLGACFIIK